MNTNLTDVKLSTSEAMVLQQIHEDGQDDVSLLSSLLGLPRGRAVALINTLRHKGLLIINHDYQGSWVQLSNKGNRLIAYLWPETQGRLSAA